MSTKRVKLTSERVAVYRYILVPFALLLLVTVVPFVLYIELAADETPWMALFVLLWVVIAIGLAFWTPEIYFDRDHLYVERPFSTVTYDLKKVRRLNGCYAPADWAFQIEFFPDRGSSIKVNYHPPRREAWFFKWNKEFSGASKAFVDHIKALQELNQ
jgi:hypothetical protein